MRVSSRLPLTLEANAFTKTIQRFRETGQPLLDLTISNPTAAGLAFPEGILREALALPEVCTYSPDPNGNLAARVAIAEWHGHGVSPSQVLLTASTSEAYAWLFKLLCDPGDAVLVPSPSYPLFEWLARLENVEVIHSRAYFHERWELDLGALEAACTDRTRALIVVNPNNPTGQFLSRSEWEALTDLCARKNMSLLVDEVFGSYALEILEDQLPTALEDMDPPCPVFVLSGLSKIAALPQVKAGWILARGAKAVAMLEPLAFIADQYLSVSASAQAAIPSLLQHAPILQERIWARLWNNLSILDAGLEAHPNLSRLPLEGGWTVLLRRPSLDEDEACVLRMAEHGVLVHPGHFFDLPGDAYLVLSLLTDPSVFKRGLALLLPLA